MIRVAALAGGVGGAKLAHGLAQNLSPEELTVIMNTGDDFVYMGLHICPDVDTVSYTLAGLANPVTGWGRIDETWNVMNSLTALGGPEWFNLGDRDLGTHLERTRRLIQGEPLSRITRDFCDVWGIKHTLLPMSDDPVATWVNTREMGWLAFQEYFVRERCEPQVLGFEFRGSERARPAPGVLEALDKADWVILCPSNPWVSIDPILAVPGVLDLVKCKPVAAVSPIVGGKAIKGPAAKMYRELGIEPSAEAVASHYLQRLGDMRKEFVLFIDSIDRDSAHVIENYGSKVVVTDSVMRSHADRVRLAREVISVF
jgi:LPPG:FO 2-phospho-L-lactate transferase